MLRSVRIEADRGRAHEHEAHDHVIERRDPYLAKAEQ
jgi:hypothetical protein